MDGRSPTGMFTATDFIVVLCLAAAVKHTLRNGWTTPAGWNYSRTQLLKLSIHSKRRE